MKKFSFLILIIVLVVFACTFPSEFQIIGSPSLNFYAHINFIEIFMDRIADGIGDDIVIRILDCTAITNVQTFLISMMAIEQSFDTVIDQSLLYIEIFGQIVKITEIKLGSDLLVYSSAAEDEPIILPFGELSEFLSGLNFNPDGIIAKLYFYSNHAIIEDVKITIDFIATEIDPDNPVNTLLIPKYPATRIVPVSSGIVFDNGIYPYRKLPIGGIEIENFAMLLNKKKDLKVHLDVILPANTAILTSVLEAPLHVTAEVVILLPLKFDAVKGAEIVFPSVDGAGSFVNNIADAADSFSISVGMSPQNPLNQGELIIRQQSSPPLEIISPLAAQSLNFAVNESDMNIIRALGRDFDPEISIRFPDGGSIIFPRNLGITTISLDANINHTIGF